MNTLSKIIPALLTAILLSSCATSEEAKDVTPAGYLGDYKLLHSKSKERASLVYTNPDADFSKYDSIIVEPVTTYRGPESRFKNISGEDFTRAATYFRKSLQRELGEVYTITSRSGPRTIRLRVAFTELQKSKAFLDTVTTIHPGALVASKAAKELDLTSKDSFTGKAAVEGELTDSATGERLLAGVTARVGGKKLDNDVLNEWADIEDALDHWAKELATHLAELKRG